MSGGPLSMEGRRVKDPKPFKTVDEQIEILKSGI